MSTDTVLKAEKVIEIVRDAGPDDPLSLARAIEQAVLQSPEIQALRKDADRYRYARDNIMEDHELPGGYHISEEGEYWDKTIDDAMEKQP